MNKDEANAEFFMNFLLDLFVEDIFVDFYCLKFNNYFLNTIA